MRFGSHFFWMLAVVNILHLPCTYTLTMVLHFGTPHSLLSKSTISEFIIKNQIAFDIDEDEQTEETDI